MAFRPMQVPGEGELEGLGLRGPGHRAIEYKDPKTDATTGTTAWDCSSWPECARA